jgi:hypothetical protein
MDNEVLPPLAGGLGVGSVWTSWRNAKRREFIRQAGSQRVFGLQHGGEGAEGGGFLLGDARVAIAFL